MVQTTIFLSPDRAAASSPLLLPSLPVMVATTPVVRWKSKRASCNWESITVRSETTSTVSNIFLCLRIVQLGEKMRGPGDGVGLARARRVLHQIFAARAVRQHGGLELARHIKLVVAGEDDLLDLLFLVPLGDEVAAQDFQPAFALPDLFPEIGRAVAAVGVDRIAGARRRRPG